MQATLTVWVLITTMNQWLQRVLDELLPQLHEADEVIISHQITDNITEPYQWDLPTYVKYSYMFDKWLSKNRNNAIQLATTDICHICDDDLNYIPWFVDIIKKAYTQNNVDLITFQAKDEFGALHYPLKAWKHNTFSVGRISSWWITFKLSTNLLFDTDYGLWAKYPTWEENIFLRDAQKQSLQLLHDNTPIVIHPRESSGIQYNDDLIQARTMVFKRMYGWIWALASIPYFAILHYHYYQAHYNVLHFLILSLRWLVWKRS